MDNAVFIAKKIIEAQKDIKWLWGDKFQKQIAEYISLIKGVSEKEQMKDVHSILDPGSIPGTSIFFLLLG